MGSEGSTGVELDLEKIKVREKTSKVPISSVPTGPEEEGPATLRCACVGAGTCVGVGVGVGAGVGVASFAMRLMVFRSIKR